MVKPEQTFGGFPSDWEFQHPDEEIHGPPASHTTNINISNLKLTFHDGHNTHYTFKIRPRRNHRGLKLTMTNDYNGSMWTAWDSDNTVHITKPVYLGFSSSSNISDMDTALASVPDEDSSDNCSGVSYEECSGDSLGGKKSKKKNIKKKNRKTKKIKKIRLQCFIGCWTRQY
jgi:hypothetical protein